MHLLCIALLWAGLTTAQDQSREIERPPDISDPRSTEQESKHSAAVVVAAILGTTIGLFLLIAGRRGWRVTCALSGSLATALVFYSALAHAVNGEGYGLQLFGIILGIALVGAAFCWFSWLAGLLLTGAGGAVAFGVTLLLLGEDLLIDKSAGRIAVLVLLALAGGFSMLFSRYKAVAILSSIYGTSLCAIGIDYGINGARGSVSGIQRIFIDPQIAYKPPQLTRILLGASWILALVASGFQIWLWKERAFIRTEEVVEAEEIYHEPLSQSPTKTRALYKMSKRFSLQRPEPSKGDLEAPRRMRRATLADTKPVFEVKLETTSSPQPEKLKRHTFAAKPHRYTVLPEAKPVQPANAVLPPSSRRNTEMPSFTSVSTGPLSQPERRSILKPSVLPPTYASPPMQSLIQPEGQHATSSRSIATASLATKPLPPIRMSTVPPASRYSDRRLTLGLGPEAGIGGDAEKRRQSQWGEYFSDFAAR